VKYRSLATLILIFASQLAWAQTSPDTTRQYRSCVATSSSMADSRRCDSEELERQKALLNAEFKIATAHSKPSDKANLDKAQQSWVTFRDLDCRAKSAAVSGSGAADAHFQCMLQHVQARKIQLESYWSL
jgi:uncharacterized protein YecT (DUF1311 family)